MCSDHAWQIEAVGHNYLGAFFAACDALLAPDGVMVMQAITTPENRYEEYIKSTDFINTIIFPGELVTWRGHTGILVMMSACCFSMRHRIGHDVLVCVRFPS